MVRNETWAINEIPLKCIFREFVIGDISIWFKTMNKFIAIVSHRKRL